MKLLLLLLGLGLTLVCAHAEGETSPGGKNFDPIQIEGEWNSILLASDKKEKIEEDGDMRVFADFFYVFENGSLAFHFYAFMDGKCVEQYLVCDRTENDGEYYVKYDGNNTFTVLDVDTDDYVIFYLNNVKDEETFQLMALYGREPDLSSDIKVKFTELCEKHGISETNIVNLTKAVGMVPEHALVPALQTAVPRLKMKRPEPPVLSGDFSPGPQHHPSLLTLHPVTSSVV
ncbi:major urinary protein 20-like [Acomys russatus]|uniref:major urinary protein 20-like n=1 Tax=Acomys russatus TaxID=60746 RepID=UPI0021E1D874|nr:major urinary protein 20-like [Acomys russatus]